MSSESATTIPSSNTSEAESDKAKFIRDTLASKESTRLALNNSSIVLGKSTPKKITKAKKQTKKAAAPSVSINIEDEGTEEHKGKEAKEDSKDGTATDRYYIKMDTIQGDNCYLSVEKDVLGNPTIGLGNLKGNTPDKNSEFIWTIEYKDDGTSIIYNATEDEEKPCYWKNKRGRLVLRTRSPDGIKRTSSKITSSGGGDSASPEAKKTDPKMSWNIFVTYENQARIRSTQSNKFMCVDKDGFISFKGFKEAKEMPFDLISVDKYEKDGFETKSGLTDNHKKFLEALEKKIKDGEI